MWVVTGGTHTGVMKHVGEAMRDHELTSTGTGIVSIGIATWGCIHQREKLIRKEVNIKHIYAPPNASYFQLCIFFTVLTLQCAVVIW